MSDNGPTDTEPSSCVVTVMVARPTQRHSFAFAFSGAGKHGITKSAAPNPARNFRLFMAHSKLDFLHSFIPLDDDVMNGRDTLFLTAPVTEIDIGTALPVLAADHVLAVDFPGLSAERAG